MSTNQLGIYVRISHLRSHRTYLALKGLIPELSNKSVVEQKYGISRASLYQIAKREHGRQSYKIRV